MKLYHHPASTTSRIVMLFAAESGIRYEPIVVDLFTGEQLGERYAALNPSRLIPMLEDGTFRLTECSAILKYLAETTGSPAYPADTRQRARVNERMDWFNTQFSRDFCYGFVYPQIFPPHRRPHAGAQAATLDWHRGRARQWLAVLDGHLIGSNEYVCGNEITIADYLGAPMVALGGIVGVEFARYPNVQRWLAKMKALPAWKKVFAVINDYAASIAADEFDPLEAAELEAA